MSLADGFWFWMGRWLVDILQFAAVIVAIFIFIAIFEYLEHRARKRRDKRGRDD